MNTKQLHEAFELAGYEIRSYSGRGMCGKECLGVTCSSPVRMVAEVLAAFARDSEDTSEVAALAALLSTADTDSMGRETIVYWTTLDPPETNPADE
jgi:hypothetical protein